MFTVRSSQYALISSGLQGARCPLSSVRHGGKLCHTNFPSWCSISRKAFTWRSKVVTFVTFLFFRASCLPPARLITDTDSCAMTASRTQGKKLEGISFCAAAQLQLQVRSHDTVRLGAASGVRQGTPVVVHAWRPSPRCSSLALRSGTSTPPGPSLAEGRLLQ